MTTRAESRPGPGRLRLLIVAAVWLAVAGSAVTANPVAADPPAAPGGSVVAWGANDDGELNVPVGLDHVVAVSASDWGTALALKSDGTVVSWGHGGSVPAGLSDVTAISAGEDFFLALKKDGEVVAWGDGTSETVATQAVAVAAGNAWGIALERDGSMVPVGRISEISYQVQDAVSLSTGGGFAIGRNGDPLVLDGGPAPWPASLHDVTSISDGMYWAMALKTDGSIVSWGANGRGQQNVPRSFNFKAIAAGSSFGLALRTDGTIVGWGDNSYGQLNIPEGLAGVTAIAAGQTFGLAVTDSPPHGVPGSALLLVGFEVVGALLFLGGLALLLTSTRRGWLTAAPLNWLTGPWMPTAIALALAILSMPLVAATFAPSDGTAALGLATPLAIWTAAAGSVLVSALVASRFGARRVRAHPVFGTCQTFVVALLIAIPMAPLLPFLLGQQIAFGQYCFFTCGHTYTGTQFLPGALVADLLLPLAPFAEPGPVVLLAIGVVIWSVIVRHWPGSLGAQQDTPPHAQSGQAI